MTLSTSNEAERAAQAVLVLFAGINNSMWELGKLLSSNPAVVRLTQECDVQQFLRSEWVLPDCFSFHVDVDVETKTSDVFWWSFDLSLEAEEWTLSRDIEIKGKDGPESVREFDPMTYASFAELQDGYAPLMAEFVRSAEAFSFPS
jgi:hypothetical protein